MSRTPDVASAGRYLQDACHDASRAAGWWNAGSLDLRDQARGRTLLGLMAVGTKISLIHSEVSEGMEGHRKDLMDDHLLHRPSIEVELADAAIRLFDLAGALALDIGGAIEEKMAYNVQRADHQAGARAQAGGKAY